MFGDFFTSVNTLSSNTPIQLLRKPDDMEHTSTETMAQYNTQIRTIKNFLQHKEHASKVQRPTNSYRSGYLRKSLMP